MSKSAAAFWLVAVALLAAGCSSGPKIYTNQNPEVTLRDYQTFGFSSDLGTDRGSNRSIISTHLVRATTAEMEKRGYRFQAVNPDLEINFYLHTQEKIRSSTTPTAGVGYGGYYGYRRGYYGTWGGYETTVTQYTEGTLTVDLIDNARDILVWEGTAVGRMRESNRDKLEESANVIMAEIFEAFPLAQ